MIFIQRTRQTVPLNNTTGHATTQNLDSDGNDMQATWSQWQKHPKLQDLNLFIVLKNIFALHFVLVT